MPELSVSQVLYLIAVAAFTVAAAVSDMRSRKIRNELTVSFFVAGLAFHTAVDGLDGFLYALLGFAAGFGIFFLLWIIGTGGGGDTKLMGALGAWLGWKQTLLVMVVATVVVILLTIVLMVYRAATGEAVKMATNMGDDTGSGKSKKKSRPLSREEKTAQKQQRRLMAFALPVAIATWLVVFLNTWGYLPERFR